jgi:hypothetical protein
MPFSLKLFLLELQSFFGDYPDQEHWENYLGKNQEYVGSHQRNLISQSVVKGVLQVEQHSDHQLHEGLFEYLYDLVKKQRLAHVISKLLDNGLFDAS